MAKLFILTSKKHGIFMGVGLGLAFWSADECAGQFEVPGAPTHDDAQQMVKDMDLPIPEFDDVEVKELETESGQFATIEELDAAGLGEYLAPLRQARQDYNDNPGY